MGDIIIASGGQGGSYMVKYLRAHKRPDVIFYHDREISEILKNSAPPYTQLQIRKPTTEEVALFAGRTRGWFTLDLNKTVEMNMVDYLNKVSVSENVITVLAGKLLFTDSFFKKHKIENVLCVIRHPIHIMIALMVIRHPRQACWYGGINTKECVEDYAYRWNSIAEDVIGGNVKIVRHEFAEVDTKDIENDNIKMALRGLYSSERFHGILRPKYERLLKELVSDNYFKIYDEWDI